MSWGCLVGHRGVKFSSLRLKPLALIPLLLFGTWAPVEVDAKKAVDFGLLSSNVGSVGAKVFFPYDQHPRAVMISNFLNHKGQFGENKNVKGCSFFYLVFRKCSICNYI